MRVFITGGTGFAGSHLMDRLLAAGNEVVGLVHPASSHQPVPDHPNFRPILGDLMELSSLKSAVSEVRPDVIYHLAGMALTNQSWEDPARTLAINAGGTANLLEAARNWGKPRVVVVTSAEIYGQVAPDMLPITENSEPNPAHPYGISKWTAGLMVHLYWERYGLPVIEARPFNHIGPRQAKGFVVPDFASQLAAIQLKGQPGTISVGNLSAERDFTDVRDVVRAYTMLAEDGRPGESYLICSGVPTSIEWILETMVQMVPVPVEIVRDPERMRPSETPRLVGSHAKIHRDTGWQPEIDLRQSLQDALDDWLENLGNQVTG
ncbi:MAG: GDP-mannose 4,6-dehydratase [Candidatus Promineifilaceae bacterium]